MSASGNFGFLRAYDARMERLALAAERYFATDAAASLVKLRALAEQLGRQIVARHALPTSTDASFDDLLRALRARSLLPPRISEALYFIKNLGNAAAHEDEGTTSQALTALKLAREVAIWFHRTFGGVPGFKPGPFVPPLPPPDQTEELTAELGELRKVVLASKDAEAKAALAVQEAEVDRLAHFAHLLALRVDAVRHRQRKHLRLLAGALGC